MTVVEQSGTEPKCFKQLRCFTLFSVVSLPYAFSCLKSILLDGEQTELNSSVFFLCFLLLLRSNIFFPFFFKVLLIFGCAGASLLCGLLSSCGNQGLLSSCSARASHCSGFLLQSMGSRHAGSAVVVHRLSYSAACGIFLDQESNPHLLHW